MSENYNRINVDFIQWIKNTPTKKRREFITQIKRGLSRRQRSVRRSLGIVKKIFRQLKSNPDVRIERLKEQEIEMYRGPGWPDISQGGDKWRYSFQPVPPTEWNHAGDVGNRCFNSDQPRFPPYQPYENQQYACSGPAQPPYMPRQATGYSDFNSENHYDYFSQDTYREGHQQEYDTNEDFNRSLERHNKYRNRRKPVIRNIPFEEAKLPPPAKNVNSRKHGGHKDHPNVSRSSRSYPNDNIVSLVGDFNNRKSKYVVTEAVIPAKHYRIPRSRWEQYQNSIKATEDSMITTRSRSRSKTPRETEIYTDEKGSTNNQLMSTSKNMQVSRPSTSRSNKMNCSIDTDIVGSRKSATGYNKRTSRSITIRPCLTTHVSNIKEIHNSSPEKSNPVGPTKSKTRLANIQKQNASQCTASLNATLTASSNNEKNGSAILRCSEYSSSPERAMTRSRSRSKTPIQLVGNTPLQPLEETDSQCGAAKIMTRSRSRSSTPTSSEHLGSNGTARITRSRSRSQTPTPRSKPIDRRPSNDRTPETSNPNNKGQAKMTNNNLQSSEDLIKVQVYKSQSGSLKQTGLIGDIKLIKKNATSKSMPVSKNNLNMESSKNSQKPKHLVGLQEPSKRSRSRSNTHKISEVVEDETRPKRKMLKLEQEPKTVTKQSAASFSSGTDKTKKKILEPTDGTTIKSQKNESKTIASQSKKLKNTENHKTPSCELRSRSKTTKSKPSEDSIHIVTEPSCSNIKQLPSHGEMVENLTQITQDAKRPCDRSRSRSKPLKRKISEDNIRVASEPPSCSINQLPSHSENSINKQISKGAKTPSNRPCSQSKTPKRKPSEDSIHISSELPSCSSKKSTSHGENVINSTLIRASAKTSSNRSRSRSKTPKRKASEDSIHISSEPPSCSSKQLPSHKENAIINTRIVEGAKPHSNMPRSQSKTPKRKTSEDSIHMASEPASCSSKQLPCHSENVINNTQITARSKTFSNRSRSRSKTPKRKTSEDSKHIASEQPCCSSKHLLNHSKTTMNSTQITEGAKTHSNRSSSESKTPKRKTSEDSIHIASEQPSCRSKQPPSHSETVINKTQITEGTKTHSNTPRPQSKTPKKKTSEDSIHISSEPPSCSSKRLPSYSKNVIINTQITTGAKSSSNNRSRSRSITPKRKTSEDSKHIASEQSSCSSKQLPSHSETVINKTQIIEGAKTHSNTPRSQSKTPKRKTSEDSIHISSEPPSCSSKQLPSNSETVINKTQIIEGAKTHSNTPRSQSKTPKRKTSEDSIHISYEPSSCSTKQLPSHSENVINNARNTAGTKSSSNNRSRSRSKTPKRNASEDSKHIASEQSSCISKQLPSHSETVINKTQIIEGAKTHSNTPRSQSKTPKRKTSEDSIHISYDPPSCSSKQLPSHSENVINNAQNTAGAKSSSNNRSRSRSTTPKRNTSEDSKHIASEQSSCSSKQLPSYSENVIINTQITSGAKTSAYRSRSRSKTPKRRASENKIHIASESPSCSIKSKTLERKTSEPTRSKTPNPTRGDDDAETKKKLSKSLSDFIEFEKQYSNSCIGFEKKKSQTRNGQQSNDHMPKALHDLSALERGNAELKPVNKKKKEIVPFITYKFKIDYIRQFKKKGLTKQEIDIKRIKNTLIDSCSSSDSEVDESRNKEGSLSKCPLEAKHNNSIKKQKHDDKHDMEDEYYSDASIETVMLPEKGRTVNNEINDLTKDPSILQKFENQEFVSKWLASQKPESDLPAVTNHVHDCRRKLFESNENVRNSRSDKKSDKTDLKSSDSNSVNKSKYEEIHKNKADSRKTSMSDLKSCRTSAKSITGSHSSKLAHTLSNIKATSSKSESENNSDNNQMIIISVEKHNLRKSTSSALQSSERFHTKTNQPKQQVGNEHTIIPKEILIPDQDKSNILSTNTNDSLPERHTTNITIEDNKPERNLLSNCIKAKLQKNQISLAVSCNVLMAESDASSSEIFGHQSRHEQGDVSITSLQPSTKSDLIPEPAIATQFVISRSESSLFLDESRESDKNMLLRENVNVTMVSNSTNGNLMAPYIESDVLLNNSEDAVVLEQNKNGSEERNLQENVDKCTVVSETIGNDNSGNTEVMDKDRNDWGSQIHQKDACIPSSYTLVEKYIDTETSVANETSLNNLKEAEFLNQSQQKSPSPQELPLAQNVDIHSLSTSVDEDKIVQYPCVVNDISINITRCSELMYPVNNKEFSAIPRKNHAYNSQLASSADKKTVVSELSNTSGMSLNGPEDAKLIDLNHAGPLVPPLPSSTGVIIVLPELSIASGISSNGPEGVEYLDRDHNAGPLVQPMPTSTGVNMVVPETYVASGISSNVSEDAKLLDQDQNGAPPLPTSTGVNMVVPETYIANGISSNGSEDAKLIDQDQNAVPLVPPLPTSTGVNMVVPEAYIANVISSNGSKDAKLLDQDQNTDPVVPPLPTSTGVIIVLPELSIASEISSNGPQNAEHSVQDNHAGLLVHLAPTSTGVNMVVPETYIASGISSNGPENAKLLDQDQNAGPLVPALPTSTGVNMVLPELSIDSRILSNGPEGAKHIDEDHNAGPLVHPMPTSTGVNMVAPETYVASGISSNGSKAGKHLDHDNNSDPLVSALLTSTGVTLVLPELSIDSGISSNGPGGAKHLDQDYNTSPLVHQIPTSSGVNMVSPELSIASGISSNGPEGAKHLDQDYNVSPLVHPMPTSTGVNMVVPETYIASGVSSNGPEDAELVDQDQNAGPLVPALPTSSYASVQEKTVLSESSNSNATMLNHAECSESFNQCRIVTGNEDMSLKGQSSIKKTNKLKTVYKETKGSSENQYKQHTTPSGDTTKICNIDHILNQTIGTSDSIHNYQEYSRKDKDLLQMPQNSKAASSTSNSIPEEVEDNGTNYEGLYEHLSSAAETIVRISKSNKNVVMAGLSKERLTQIKPLPAGSAKNSFTFKKDFLKLSKITKSIAKPKKVVTNKPRHEKQNLLKNADVFISRTEKAQVLDMPVLDKDGWEELDELFPSQCTSRAETITMNSVPDENNEANSRSLQCTVTTVPGETIPVINIDCSRTVNRTISTSDRIPDISGGRLGGIIDTEQNSCPVTQSSTGCTRTNIDVVSIAIPMSNNTTITSTLSGNGKPENSTGSAQSTPKLTNFGINPNYLNIPCTLQSTPTVIDMDEKIPRQICNIQPEQDENIINVDEEYGSDQSQCTSRQTRRSNSLNEQAHTFVGSIRVRDFGSMSDHMKDVSSTTNPNLKDSGDKDLGDNVNQILKDQLLGSTMTLYMQINALNEKLKQYNVSKSEIKKFFDKDSNKKYVYEHAREMLRLRSVPFSSSKEYDKFIDMFDDIRKYVCEESAETIPEINTVPNPSTIQDPTPTSSRPNNPMIPQPDIQDPDNNKRRTSKKKVVNKNVMEGESSKKKRKAAPKTTAALPTQQITSQLQHSSMAHIGSTVYGTRQFGDNTVTSHTVQHQRTSTFSGKLNTLNGLHQSTTETVTSTPYTAMMPPPGYNNEQNSVQRSDVSITTHRELLPTTCSQSILEMNRMVLSKPPPNIYNQQYSLETSDQRRLPPTQTAINTDVTQNAMNNALAPHTSSLNHAQYISQNYNGFMGNHSSIPATLPARPPPINNLQSGQTYNMLNDARNNAYRQNQNRQYAPSLENYLLQQPAPLQPHTVISTVQCGSLNGESVVPENRQSNNSTIQRDCRAIVTEVTHLSVPDNRNQQNTSAAYQHNYNTDRQQYNSFNKQIRSNQWQGGYSTDHRSNIPTSDQQNNHTAHQQRFLQPSNHQQSTQGAHREQNDPNITRQQTIPSSHQINRISELSNQNTSAACIQSVPAAHQYDINEEHRRTRQFHDTRLQHTLPIPALEKSDYFEGHRQAVHSTANQQTRPPHRPLNCSTDNQQPAIAPPHWPSPTSQQSNHASSHWQISPSTNLQQPVHSTSNPHRTPTQSYWPRNPSTSLGQSVHSTTGQQPATVPPHQQIDPVTHHQQSFPLMTNHRPAPTSDHQLLNPLINRQHVPSNVPPPYEVSSREIEFTSVEQQITSIVNTNITPVVRNQVNASMNQWKSVPKDKQCNMPANQQGKSLADRQRNGSQMQQNTTPVVSDGVSLEINRQQMPADRQRNGSQIQQKTTPAVSDGISLEINRQQMHADQQSKSLADRQRNGSQIQQKTTPAVSDGVSLEINRQQHTSVVNQRNIPQIQKKFIPVARDEVTTEINLQQTISEVKQHNFAENQQQNIQDINNQRNASNSPQEIILERPETSVQAATDVNMRNVSNTPGSTELSDETTVLKVNEQAPIFEIVESDDDDDDVIIIGDIKTEPGTSNIKVEDNQNQDAKLTIPIEITESIRKFIMKQVQIEANKAGFFSQDVAGAGHAMGIQAVRNNSTISADSGVGETVEDELLRSPDPTPHVVKCTVCNKDGNVCCANCNVTVYCSPACQKRHWLNGHNNACISANSIQSSSDSAEDNQL